MSTEEWAMWSRRAVWTTAVATLVAGIVATVAVAQCLLILWAPIGSSSTEEVFSEIFRRQMNIRVLQLVSSFVMGFYCMLVGVVMAWLGVKGGIDMKVDSSESSISFRTTQAGIVLIVVGLLLSSVAMMVPPLKFDAPGGWHGEMNAGQNATKSE